MKPNESQDKSVALSYLTNYIFQEAHRASVIQQHTGEYNRIQKLLNKVLQTLGPLKEKINERDIQELAELIVDHIVLEYSQDRLFEKVAHYLAQLDPDEEEGGLFNELSKICVPIVSKLYTSHLNWSTDIKHHCAPSVLTWPLMLNPALEYVTQKLYKTSICPTEDGYFYNYTPPPFSIAPMEGKPLSYRFREQYTQEQKIPDSAIFRRLMLKQSSIKSLQIDEKHLSALAALNFCEPNTKSVDIINELQLTIDLSQELCKRELERMLFDLHARIQHIQQLNSNSSMMLAEDLDQLEKAHNTPNLGEFNLTKHMDLSKPELNGVDTLFDAKNAIIGMMVWHHHFITEKTCEEDGTQEVVYRLPKREQAKTLSFEHIEKQLKTPRQEGPTQPKRGYEHSTIKKGYDTASKAIQSQLIIQRSGRYQNRKLSPQRNKALLDMPDFEQTKLHPNDKDTVDARIKRLNSRQFDALLKQHEDGSIWVIPRKRPQIEL